MNQGFNDLEEKNNLLFFGQNVVIMTIVLVPASYVM